MHIGNAIGLPVSPPPRPPDKVHHVWRRGVRDELVNLINHAGVRKAAQPPLPLYVDRLEM